MSATLLGNVASGISTTLAGVTAIAKVYTYEPRDLDVLPAVTITGPSNFTRRSPDEAESQLGAYDWHLTYLVRLYVTLDDPATSVTDSRSILGQMIAAIDANPTLGLGTVLDSVIASGEYGVTDPSETNQRQMSVYQCQCEVWALA